MGGKEPYGGMGTIWLASHRADFQVAFKNKVPFPLRQLGRKCCALQKTDTYVFWRDWKAYSTVRQRSTFPQYLYFCSPKQHLLETFESQHCSYLCHQLWFPWAKATANKPTGSPRAIANGARNLKPGKTTRWPSAAQLFQHIGPIQGRL